MAAPNKNMMNEMVSVHIPRMSGEAEMMVVGLNGKLWNIPRGKTVTVPKPVKDIIDQSERHASSAYAYSDEKKKLMSKVQGAPE